MTSSRSAAPAPLGIVLAGGAGRRLGGGKPKVLLAGRPLAAWACETLRAVLGEVAVLAKPDTQLPELDGVAVWREPAEPRHPLFALVWALERAGARPIVVCAADLPLVTPQLVARLAASATPAPRPRAVIATAGGHLQPLLGRYEPEALAPLRAALAADPAISLIRAVARLEPEVLDAPAASLANVNTAGDLRRAEAALAARPGGG